MRARRRGKIINICSLASEIGRPNIVPYATSKGGLQMLTRALAVELAPHNVQVNGIAPGFFKTDMNAPLIANAEFSAWVAQAHAGGTLGRAAGDRRRRGVPRVVRRPTTSPATCCSSTADSAWRTERTTRPPDRGIESMPPLQGIICSLRSGEGSQAFPALHVYRSLSRNHAVSAATVPALLALADGTVFRGRAIGAHGCAAPAKSCSTRR